MSHKNLKIDANVSNKNYSHILFNHSPHVGYQSSVFAARTLHNLAKHPSNRTALYKVELSRAANHAAETTCPRNADERMWTMTFNNAVGITGTQGSTSVSQNEWTISIIPQAITENAGVTVTQGNTIGTLKAVIQFITCNNFPNVLFRSYHQHCYSQILCRQWMTG